MHHDHLRHARREEGRAEGWGGEGRSGLGGGSGSGQAVTLLVEHRPSSCMRHGHVQCARAHYFCLCACMAAHMPYA
eukprot:281401-Chlamydomonas_euryale.AAC.1